MTTNDLVYNKRLGGYVDKEYRSNKVKKLHCELCSYQESIRQKEKIKLFCPVSGSGMCLNGLSIKQILCKN